MSSARHFLPIGTTSDAAHLDLRWVRFNGIGLKGIVGSSSGLIDGGRRRLAHVTAFLSWPTSVVQPCPSIPIRQPNGKMSGIRTGREPMRSPGQTTRRATFCARQLYMNRLGRRALGSCYSTLCLRLFVPSPSPSSSPSPSLSSFAIPARSAAP